MNIIQRILSNGLEEVQTSKQEKKIRILNFMTLMLLITTFIFILIELFIAYQNIKNLSCLFVILILTSAIIYFENKTKYYIACSLYLFTVWVYTMLFAFVFKPGSQVEYFLIMIPALSLVFVDNKRVTLFILTFCIVSFMIPQFFLPNFSFAKQAYAAKTLLFISVYVLVNFFKKLNTNNEAKLANKINELEKIKNFQNQFFLNVAHEIRTPLTIIGGYNRRLMKTFDSETISFSNTVTIEDEIKKLNQMVDDVMLLSNMKRGEKIKLSPVLINEVLNKLIISFKPLFIEKGIRLIYKNNIDVHVLASNSYLDRVLSNLLMNAMKYTIIGGTIKVELIHDDAFVKINVIDSGIGILEEDIELIFNRYYQVNHNTNFAGGNGIGLAFCKEVVAEMNGEIYAKSKFGEGSTFTVEFPIFNHKKEVFFENTNEEKLLPLLIDNKQLTKTKKETILIVEDHAKMRIYIKSILSDYNIVESVNGEEAWKYLKSNIPDLVITDHMMPCMNGEELVANIRNIQFKKLSNTAIIVLTAVSDIKQKLNYLELGVDDYIEKPFHEEELLARVRYSLLKVLERKKALQEFTEQEILSSNLDQDKHIPELIQKIGAYIYKECSSYQFGIKMILEHFCLTNSTLYRKVKLHSGQSPNQWITEIRLQKAQQLIFENKEISKKQLVTEVGMKNITHFKKLYKERFGVDL